MDQSIDNVFSISNTNIYGNIFIGNLAAASNLKTLKKHNIKAVITVAKGNKLVHSSQQLPDYLYIPALDHSNFDMTQYFTQSSNFIDKCLSYTNVLVHCVAGISRSSTLVIAYLMKILQKSSKQVIEIVKNKRQIISPNSGFKFQLKFYESILKQQRINIVMKKQIFSPETSDNIKTQKKIQQKTKFTHQRRFSCPGGKSKWQLSDVFNRGMSNQKLKRKNIKLESNRKCFQKMVLNNQKRVQERLQKIIKHI